MSNQPRYHKLVEFAAHAGDVRCVRIGRKTAGVLVTGGDDKKVNVWAIGRTTASFSLTGHQSSVESVSFDNDECVVASGGANGSIKVFELQSGKVTKSLPGHKSNVVCLAWHPFAPTIVSGSMDTNVKVWSLRDKDAIMTFKGHNAGVSYVRFSPDGNWVASASSDGAVKIWDIKAGKLVTDLCQPTKHEVTGLEFSPTEYVLATSARDKVVRLWDLENFSNYDTTSPEATPVRNICWSKDGRNIFSAVQDGCRVWSAEPMESYDYIDVPWYRVSDLTVNSLRGAQRLLGCSFHSTMVGLFYITLRNVRPFCDDPDFMAREGGASVEGSVYSGQGGGGGNGGGSQPTLAAVAAAAQLPPEGAMRRMAINDRSHDRSGDGYSNGSGSGPGAGGGRSSSASSAAPPAMAAAPASRSGSGSASAGRLPPAGPSAPVVMGGMLPPVGLPPSGAGRYADYGAGAGDSAASDYVRDAGRAASGSSAGARPPMVSVGVGVGDSLMRGALDGAPGGDAGRAQPSQPPARARSYGDRQREPPVEVHAPPYPRQREAAVDLGGPADRDRDQRYQWQDRQGQAGPLGGDRDRDRERDRDRDRDRGLGGGVGAGGGGAAYASVSQSDLEVATALLGKHGAASGLLRKRAQALKLTRNFAAKNDWRGAINCVRRCDDPAVMADLLEAMQERRDGVSLDLVGDVVSAIDTVLFLPNDRQVSAGLDMAAMLVRAFGGTIKDMMGAQRGVGIDLSFEERRERAAKARTALLELVPRLQKMSRHDTLGMRAKDLAAQLSAL
ncbi:hypothetical protein HYH03_004215 [Edaphochlamys debaryana]|uniref:Katanin p80 WD40 repeat-containing subunit B1 homolog n=1 Tax=Edaphochlamys debaryana TaxID=47281 RepID=A0A836C3L6_9CHLO|nr:hypothetical protein HYH03_004215 [Edaphochlamys debaryana]|eukprot:KAG2497953.1 hypothetical protein HYH03_004215 [Edaphochlamys debaryana]